MIPGVNQSGTHKHKSVRTSKRGSTQLRKTLFLIMSVLMKRAPDHDSVYCFIQKKRNEEKPFFVCMNAGANKFLLIYFARVREHLATL
ncbi:transposase [Enterococcus sp. OL5]|uniref:transposase n=1 Tax=Enterococcus sp. OL5 TaxID=2590214 RepID=UPI00398375C2